MKRIILLLIPLLLCGCGSNKSSNVNTSFDFTLTNFDKISNEELEKEWYPKFEKGIAKKEFIEMFIKCHDVLWLSPKYDYEITKATYTFTKADYIIEHEGYKGELFFVNILVEARYVSDKELSKAFSDLSFAEFDNLYLSFLYTNESALKRDKISRKDIVLNDNIGFGYECGTLNDNPTETHAVTLYLD